MSKAIHSKLRNNIVPCILLVFATCFSSFGQDPFQDLSKNKEFLEILNNARRGIRRPPNSEAEVLELLNNTQKLTEYLQQYIEDHTNDGSVGEFFDHFGHDHDFFTDSSLDTHSESENLNTSPPNAYTEHTEAEQLRLAACAESEYFSRNWNNNGLFLSYESYTNLPEQLVIPLGPFKASYYNSFNSGFGPRWGGKMHMGIDLSLQIGAPIYAAFDGKVRYARFNTGGYGNLVVIRHCNGLETYYAHLDKISVQPNEMVSSGQLIGLGGTTGRSSGPHLHFEVRYHEFAFDPMLFIDQNTFELKTDTLVLSREDFHTLRWKGDSGYSGPSRYTSPKETTYTVKDGETLYSIASSTKMSVEDLLFLNGIHNPDRIFPGQTLTIE